MLFSAVYFILMQIENWGTGKKHKRKKTRVRKKPEREKIPEEKKQ